MAAYDDLDVKRIFLVGVASAVVTAVTALAVQVVYYSMAQWQAVETQKESNYDSQNRILLEQQQAISTYGVDPETGNILIPIDEAIEAFVNEQANKPSANASNVQSGSDET
jgi:hypothetical protein